MRARPNMKGSDMSDVTSSAEYERMANDSLEQSWGRDSDEGFKLRAAIRAQVYATLAQVAVQREVGRG